MNQPIRYRGRFAPSPTGPLHFGSLVAALGSYLEARSRDGEWLVRMEDLDPPREVEGAADDILRSLETFGFEWQGPVLYQSHRTGAYDDAMAALHDQGLTYHCGCTRREISQAAITGVDGPVYPGTCRDGLPAGKQERSVRVRTHDNPIAFEDAVQGPLTQTVRSEVGDFIIRRADGLYAYHLAVVLDDAEQDISHVVRGADLLLSTPRQIHLQSVLGFPSLEYLHLPVALNKRGDKLSKQTGAAPVDWRAPLPALLAAWRFLGQTQPLESPANLAEFWEWASSSWQPGLIPRQTTGPIS